MILRARNGAEVVVRAIAAGDAGALRRFNAALSPATRSVFLPHAYDEATIGRYIARDQAGQDRTYLLWSGKEIVGYFFLWEFDRPVPLLGIGLAEAWQGQGLGGWMLRILIADAKTAGRDAIELTTVPENARALRLYERLGFQHAGDVENVAGDGRVVRERRMFLALKAGARAAEREFRPPA